jgi:hypothetical protein
MKKTLSKVALATILLSSSSFPVLASGSDFKDINGSYAKDAILQLAQAGILNGKGNGTFDPTGKVSRQDFAVILAKALNLDVGNPPASATFSDVPTNHWSYAYVEAATKAGLINGKGDGTYGFGQNLTRQDMAVLFVRALGSDVTGKGAGLTFSDKEQISSYAKDAVAYAVELKLLSGHNNTFDPKGTAERQAVAKVASNFLKVQQSEKPNPVPTPEPVPTPDPEPKPEPVPAPEPTPKPEPVPVPTPTPDPEPNPNPDPDPDPNPNPEPEPIPAPTSAAIDPIMLYDVDHDLVLSARDIIKLKFSQDIHPNSRENITSFFTTNNLYGSTTTPASARFIDSKTVEVILGEGEGVSHGEGKITFTPNQVVNSNGIQASANVNFAIPNYFQNIKIALLAVNEATADNMQSIIEQYAADLGLDVSKYSLYRNLNNGPTSIQSSYDFGEFNREGAISKDIYYSKATIGSYTLETLQNTFVRSLLSWKVERDVMLELYLAMNNKQFSESAKIETIVGIIQGIFYSSIIEDLESAQATYSHHVNVPIAELVSPEGYQKTLNEYEALSYLQKEEVNRAILAANNLNHRSWESIHNVIVNKLQEFRNMINQINVEASTGIWTLNEISFALAGITGVSSENLDDVRSKIGEAYQANNQPLTLEKVQQLVYIVIIENAQKGKDASPITIEILNSASNSNLATNENLALYQTAIVTEPIVNFDHSEVIYQLINVINEVALAGENLLTVDDAASATPTLIVAPDRNNVTFSTVLVQNINILLPEMPNEKSIKITNRGNGGSLRINIAAESTSYSYFIDYIVTVPESGDITIIKASQTN